MITDFYDLANSFYEVEQIKKLKSELTQFADTMDLIEVNQLYGYLQLKEEILFERESYIKLNLPKGVVMGGNFSKN